MKAIFRKIRDILQPQPQLQRPFGLFAEQTQKLAELRLEDGWQVFQEVLDASVNINAEALLATRDAYSDTYLKGVITGLRKAGTLVDEIIAKTEENARAADRTAIRNQPSPIARVAATYGTPAWRGRPAGAAAGNASGAASSRS